MKSLLVLLLLVPVAVRPAAGGVREPVREPVPKPGVPGAAQQEGEPGDPDPEPAPARPGAAGFQERVNAAVDRGVHWLKKQHLEGQLAFSGRAGARALTLYALLKSGVPARHPSARALLGALEGARPERTYDSGCLLLALAATGSDEHAAWMQQHADALVRWGQDGIWGYPSGGDLSNTQYAALGLWAAARAGVEVDDKVWLRLGDGVLRHQVGDGGFGYSGRGHATGSMTAAGVGCLAIALERLSSGGELERDVFDHWRAAMDEGLAWLGREFTPDENPRAARNWHLYWLYGMERVGALAGVGRVGGHDWYREGAEVLLAAQSEDGSWSESGSGGVDVSTAFALLFLQRATLPKSGRLAWSRDVYGRDDPALDISLRAAGDSPLQVWISRFGRDALAAHRWPGEVGEGLRVLRVDYLVDGAVAASLERDPEGPSGRDRFPYELELSDRGEYRLEARAYVWTPPASDDTEPGVTVLRSEPLQVRVRRVDPTWQRVLSEARGQNLVPPDGAKWTASSVFQGLDPETLGAHVEAAPELAFDGDPRTYWLAVPTDRAPELSLRLAQALEVDTVLLNHARVPSADASFFARALEVELVLNRTERHRVRLGPGERGPTVFELPAPTALRSLTVRVLTRAPGAGVDAVGFAEVQLQRRGR